MHLDDTPIKVITEIIVLGKLLKEIVWSKPVRRAGRYLFKKINSVPRGILKKSSHVLILRPGCGKTQYLVQAASIHYVRESGLQKKTRLNYFLR